MNDAQLIAAAREWIADCEWGDDFDVNSLNDAQVRRGVGRHYAGGWVQFTADSNPLEYSR